MAKNSDSDLTHVRNLGVIAHIDAGKTTTTEHLLYYAGAKHKLGGVDEGTTDTDYDPEEQERGITIYSACIPFEWRGYTINLIDTPGPRRFHRRGRALAARARRRGRRLRRARRASRRSRKRSGGRPTSTACRGWCSSTRWTWSARTSRGRSKSIHVAAHARTRTSRAGRCRSSSPSGRAAQGQPHAVRRRHRPDRDEGAVLRRRRPRQDGPRRRHPRGERARGARVPRASSSTR